MMKRKRDIIQDGKKEENSFVFSLLCSSSFFKFRFATQSCRTGSSNKNGHPQFAGFQISTSTPDMLQGLQSLGISAGCALGCVHGASVWDILSLSRYRYRYAKSRRRPTRSLKMLGKQHLLTSTQSLVDYQVCPPSEITAFVSEVSPLPINSINFPASLLSFFITCVSIAP